MVREKKNYSGSRNSKSNGLEWNWNWSENRERPSINSKCIDWNYSSHSSPSNLCSTQPKHKHFARQRNHICQQNVWSEGQAIYETMRNQNTNHLFSQEICRNWIDTSIMEGQNKDSVWKNAEKLVDYIWFSLCFHFARRGREGWWELTRQVIWNVT